MTAASSPIQPASLLELPSAPTAPPVIQVRGLVKRYGSVEAVRGIDLEVERGEIFGFLGPNGAGKSTTIQTLCTLLRPTSGSATVAGHDVVTEAAAVRSRIGLVFQDPSLDIQLTARENLTFHAMIYSVPRALRRQRIDEALGLVDLTDRADHLVATFSGGMRRRLEIARGIIHHPDVLFLDEPTQGLDPQTRVHIWDYLRDLRRQAGVTVFLTTHYMDEAEYSDRIAIIDHGRIVAQGTPAQLKAQVGGDVVVATTADDPLAAAEIGERLGVDAVSTSGGLRMEVPDGSVFVPRLMQATSVEVRSISVRRPSLDDVFLHLTGREMREEEADPRAMMRAMGMRWGGRAR